MGVLNGFGANLSAACNSGGHSDAQLVFDHRDGEIVDLALLAKRFTQVVEEVVPENRRSECQHSTQRYRVLLLVLGTEGSSGQCGDTRPTQDSSVGVHQLRFQLYPWDSPWPLVGDVLVYPEKRPR